jgi:hypothetical protein
VYRFSYYIPSRITYTYRIVHPLVLRRLLSRDTIFHMLMDASHLRCSHVLIGGSPVADNASWLLQRRARGKPWALAIVGRRVVFSGRSWRAARIVAERAFSLGVSRRGDGRQGVVCVIFLAVRLHSRVQSLVVRVRRCPDGLLLNS